MIKLSLIIFFGVISHCFEIKNDLGSFNRILCFTKTDYDNINDDDI